MCSESFISSCKTLIIDSQNRCERRIWRLVDKSFSASQPRRDSILFGPELFVKSRRTSGSNHSVSVPVGNRKSGLWAFFSFWKEKLWYFYFRCHKSQSFTNSQVFISDVSNHQRQTGSGWTRSPGFLSATWHQTSGEDGGWRVIRSGWQSGTVTSPSETKWLNELTFCPELLLVLTLRKQIVVFVTAAPMMMQRGNAEVVCLCCNHRSPPSTASGSEPASLNTNRQRLCCHHNLIMKTVWIYKCCFQETEFYLGRVCLGVFTAESWDSVSLPEYQMKLTIRNQEQQQLYFQDRIHEYQMEESIRIQNSCFYFPQLLITVLTELSPPAAEPEPFKCIRLIPD